jgi:hypothetical protein
MRIIFTIPNTQNKYLLGTKHASCFQSNADMFTSKLAISSNQNPGMAVSCRVYFSLKNQKMTVELKSVSRIDQGP